MNSNEYEVILKNATDTRDIPKGTDLSYRCLSCGDVIPSIPKDNIACQCDNIYIDVDMWRLDVGDYEKMEVVRKRG